MKKETNIHVREDQRISNKIMSKRISPRHIVVKMTKSKDEERI